MKPSFGLTRPFGAGWGGASYGKSPEGAKIRQPRSNLGRGEVVLPGAHSCFLLLNQYSTKNTNRKTKKSITTNTPYIFQASALKNGICLMLVNRHINSRLTGTENTRQLIAVRLLRNSLKMDISIYGTAKYKTE
jgi:hypothetical protein